MNNDNKQSVLPSIRKNSDTLEPVICPACGQKMLKVYVPNLGFNVDLCIDGCGGIFFDNRELEVVKIPSNDISSILENLKTKNFISTDQSAIRRCGCCNSKMLKMGTGVTKIEIDVCPNCGGKFLDNGELEVLREHFTNVYEKSVIEYALRHPQSFSSICSIVLTKER